MPDCSDTHVTVPDGTTRSQRRGIWAHRADPTVTPVRRRGVLVSPPARVFLELAQVRVDLVDLVAFGDSLVHAGHLTCDDLTAVAARWSGKRSRQARRAAALVRRGVDSAPESRLRLLMVLAGLPEPEVNLIVRTADGEWRRRFDLCFPALKLIIEYDGQHHRTDAVQWNSDLLRREQLEREGWTLIVVTSQALFREPADTLRRASEPCWPSGGWPCPRVRPPPGIATSRAELIAASAEKRALFGSETAQTAPLAEKRTHEAAVGDPIAPPVEKRAP